MATNSDLVRLRARLLGLAPTPRGSLKAVLRTLAGALAILAATSASAQEAKTYKWDTFYGGLNAGYARGNNTVEHTGDGPTILPGGAGISGGSFLLSIPFLGANAWNNTGLFRGQQEIKSSGAIGGAQLGRNFIVAPGLLLGIEGDLQNSEVSGDATIRNSLVAGPPPTYAMSLKSASELSWFATLRGRLGYLVTDRLAVYGTGGLAYGEIKSNASITYEDALGSSTSSPNGTTFRCLGQTVCLSGSESKTQLGWTAGGGFEFALSESVSLKGEYLHIDLGSRTILLTTTTPLLFGGPATATTTAKFDNAYDIVRAGLNVRF